jgi:hypothetical protein
MSILTLTPDIYSALNEQTLTASDTGAVIHKALSEAKEHLRALASSAQSLALTTLGRVLEECAEPGWDGYRARAVSEATARRVETFINALPMSLTAPEIVPEPDGEIAIDWHFSPTLQLSISVGLEGPLHFAGVIGEAYGQPRVRHGTEPFEGSVGGDLLRYIHELHELAGVAAYRRAA